MNVDDSTGILSTVWRSSRPSTNHDYLPPTTSSIATGGHHQQAAATSTAWVAARPSDTEHSNDGVQPIEAVPVTITPSSPENHIVAMQQQQTRHLPPHPTGGASAGYAAQSQRMASAAVGGPQMLAAVGGGGGGGNAGANNDVSLLSQPEWTANLDRLVALFQEKCSMRIVLHREAAHYYSRRIRWLSVPSALFGTLGTITNFSTWSQDFTTEDSRAYLHYVILAAGFCGLLSTVLSVLLADSKYPAKYASSLKSYRNFDSLLKNLTVERSFEPSWRQPVRTFVRKMVDDYARYTDEAELPPQPVEKRVQRAFEDASRSAAAVAAAASIENVRSTSEITANHSNTNTNGATAAIDLFFSSRGSASSSSSSPNARSSPQSSRNDDNDNNNDDINEHSRTAGLANDNNTVATADGFSWSNWFSSPRKQTALSSPATNFVDCDEDDQQQQLRHMEEGRRVTSTPLPPQRAARITPPQSSAARYCGALPFSAMIEMQSPTFVDMHSASESQYRYVHHLGAAAPSTGVSGKLSSSSPLRHSTNEFAASRELVGGPIFATTNTSAAKNKKKKTSTSVVVRPNVMSDVHRNRNDNNIIDDEDSSASAIPLHSFALSATKEITPQTKGSSNSSSVTPPANTTTPPESNSTRPSPSASPTASPTASPMKSAISTRDSMMAIAAVSTTVEDIPLIRTRAIAEADLSVDTAAAVNEDTLTNAWRIE